MTKKPSKARAAEKVWMDLGRKQGVDMDKVLEVYDKWRVEIRKKYPNGILTGGWPEGF